MRIQICAWFNATGIADLDAQPGGLHPSFQLDHLHGIIHSRARPLLDGMNRLMIPYFREALTD
jgi:hypothetical protein